MRLSVPLLTAALLAAADLAHAQSTRTWGALNVTLETCFRASSGTDSGCNVVLTNTGTVPLRVNLTSERDTVTLPDTSVVNAKSVIFGGYEDRYGVTQVIPVGVSVRGQLNYNVTKGVRTISTLQVGDAVFRDVPLAQDLPDEPPVNAPGQPLLQADGTQLSTALLDCVRGNADVTCAFAVTNKTDENLRVQSASSDGTSFVTRRGLDLRGVRRDARRHTGTVRRQQHGPGAPYGPERGDLQPAGRRHLHSVPAAEQHGVPEPAGDADVRHPSAQRARRPRRPVPGPRLRRQGREVQRRGRGPALRRDAHQPHRCRVQPELRW